MAKPFSKTPLHSQLRDIVLRRILHGDWRPGSPLPNELELAREFGLSPGTVRKAFDWMEAAGFIVRQQGKGTYVADPTSRPIASRFDKVRRQDGSEVSGSIEVVHLAVEPAGEVAAKRLRIDASAAVCRLEQVRKMSPEGAYQYEISWLPADKFPRLAAEQPVGRGIAEIAFANAVALGPGKESVGIAPVPDAAAEALSLPVGTQALRLERILSALDDAVVEWRIAWCDPAKVCYLAQSR